MIMLDQHKTRQTSSQSFFWDAHQKSPPKCMYVVSDIQLRAGSRGHDQPMFQLDGGHDHTLLSSIKERW